MAPYSTSNGVHVDKQAPNGAVPHNNLWRQEGKYSIFVPTIRQSPQDDRSYRLITLSNGLQALLISDPKADKAAASLDVGVGHLSDPVDRPGLAHFCEHLLFMGTEQFPKENAYGEFVAQNGGGTNAYTSTTNTNYYFSVSASALSGALERFSAFFHSPLFSPSCTARELNAVDSENKKNQQSDRWRIFQLDKSLSAPDARWRKFGSGNWESLMARERPKANGSAKSNGSRSNGTATPLSQGSGEGGDGGREVRGILLDWYAQHYSANRMTLAVLGKESLDDLTTLTTNLFSPVPNRNLPPLLNEPVALNALPPMTSPWTAEQEGTTIFTKTVMDFRALEIRWVIPWQTPQYKFKPAGFISHFIGHEGYGSIFSILKKKGWIVSLSCSPSGGDRDNGFDFFRVAINLTKEGWENYQSIIKTVHAYITLLQSSPIPRWYFEEEEKLASTAFRFNEKIFPSTYVTQLSEQLSKPYAREDILSGSTLLYEYDESLVRSLLAQLTPAKARITLMARDDWATVKVGGELLFPDGVNEGEWEKEKWYGTEHIVRKTLHDEGEVVEDLHLPSPNEFIPTDFNVDKKEITEPLFRPLKIRETSLSTLWYKKDDTFWVPKASFLFNIQSPLASVTPRNDVMTQLFARLVEDALAERTYTASLAGLHYSVSGNTDGLYIDISGYSHKLSVLLDTILKEIKTFSIDAGRFAVHAEQLRQEWENRELEQPSYLSDMKVAQILRERSWSAKERLAELEFVTVEDVQRHITNLVSRTHTEALIHGNVRKDDALLIMRQVEEILGSRTLTPAERISMRSYIFPAGCNYVYETVVPNKDDVNNGITYYCQIGENTDVRLRETLRLLGQIAKEPAFDQLRTKEQLGYIVSSGQWIFTGTMGFRITIQSERDPVYLESRVDVFLEHLRVLIEEMSEADFEKERQSLIDKINDQLKNLREETRRFWNHIDDGYYEFRYRDVASETLRTISKAEVLSLLTTYVHPSSSTRSKFSAHLRSQAGPSPKMSRAASAVFLERLKAVGIPVQEDPYNKGAEMELTVNFNQKLWTAYFKDQTPDFDKTAAKELVELIAKLARQYPVEDADEEDETDRVEPREGTVYVDDLATLRSSLTLGRAAKPMELYNDLSSKL